MSTMIIINLCDVFLEDLTADPERHINRENKRNINVLIQTICAEGTPICRYIYMFGCSLRRLIHPSYEECTYRRVEKTAGHDLV